jgi:hypothetical protein
MSDISRLMVLIELMMMLEGEILQAVYPSR